MRDAVGVRELRQNLSQYLRRVVQGETLRVLERGKPVALLTPIPEHQDALDRLQAAGRVRPARLDLISLGPPPPVLGTPSISRSLAELRDEERDGR